MSRRWRVVLHDVTLAWSPVLVLVTPWALYDDVVPFRTGISVPLAVAACIAAAVAHFTKDREAIPAWLSERNAPAAVAFAVLGGVALLGFHLRPRAATIGVVAVVVGQAIGTTLYRISFGVVRPLLVPQR